MRGQLAPLSLEPLSLEHDELSEEHDACGSQRVQRAVQRWLQRVRHRRLAAAAIVAATRYDIGMHLRQPPPSVCYISPAGLRFIHPPGAIQRVASGLSRLCAYVTIRLACS